MTYAIPPEPAHILCEIRIDPVSRVGVWGISSSFSQDEGSAFAFLNVLSTAWDLDIEAPITERQRRVLVVDDDSISELFLKLVLEELGCQVESVQDGTVAVQMAVASPPDLIITDNQLPGLNGLGIVRELQGSGIPIVVISADATDKARRTHLEAGALEYIVKPATRDALRGLLVGLAPRTR